MTTHAQPRERTWPEIDRRKGGQRRRRGRIMERIVRSFMIAAMIFIIAMILSLILDEALAHDFTLAKNEAPPGVVHVGSPALVKCTIDLSGVRKTFYGVVVHAEIHSPKSDDPTRWVQREWVDQVRFAAVLCPDVITPAALERHRQMLQQ